jgi:hypothetical protein
VIGVAFLTSFSGGKILRLEDKVGKLEHSVCNKEKIRKCK